MTWGKFYFFFVYISLWTKHTQKGQQQKKKQKWNFYILILHARILKIFKLVLMAVGTVKNDYYCLGPKIEVLRYLFSFMLHSLCRSLPTVLQVFSSFFIFDWICLYWCTRRLQILLSYMRHNLSERRNNAVPWYLKLSHVVAVLQFAWCTLSCIWFG